MDSCSSLAGWRPRSTVDPKRRSLWPATLEGRRYKPVSARRVTSRDIHDTLLVSLRRIERLLANADGYLDLYRKSHGEPYPGNLLIVRG